MSSLANFVLKLKLINYYDENNGILILGTKTSNCFDFTSEYIITALEF